MKFDRSKPYNNLPEVPPAMKIESTAVLKKTASAGRALAELKGLGSAIPNQAMLIDSILLQESRSSSEIENIVTTTDALFKAFTAPTASADAATKEVLRYREAIWVGFKRLERRPILSTNVFIEIYQTIKETRASIRTTPGTKISNDATGETVYTPPGGERIIRDKLKNLEDFIHDKSDLDPLIKLAIIHYQFEAIHPFTDGNGRTGRIINILFLVMNGLLDLPVLYMSKYIIENKTNYYELLRNVTESFAWEEWILFMLDAIEQTAHHTRLKIAAIRDLLEKTTENARQHLPKKVYSKELIELIFNQPYTKGQFVVNAGIAERKTAAEYLKELEKIGILRSQKVGREKLYLNVKLLELLST
jgi:Fic family protein